MRDGKNYPPLRAAIQLGEDQARQAERFVECLYLRDGVLAGSAVEHQQRFMRCAGHRLRDHALDLLYLLHQVQLRRQPAGGIGDPGAVVFDAIESPRGELGCFVRSDGSSKPARVHMRDPSFVNLQATAPMVEGELLADMIATLAMLDPVLGGVDR